MSVRTDHARDHGTPSVQGYRNNTCIPQEHEDIIKSKRKRTKINECSFNRLAIEDAIMIFGRFKRSGGHRLSTICS